MQLAAAEKFPICKRECAKLRNIGRSILHDIVSPCLEEHSVEETLLPKIPRRASLSGECASGLVALDDRK